MIQDIIIIFIDADLIDKNFIRQIFLIAIIFNTNIDKVSQITIFLQKQNIIKKQVRITKNMRVIFKTAINSTKNGNKLKSLTI